MHNHCHIHKCHVLLALWCMAGKENTPSPVWLISPKDAADGAPEWTNTSLHQESFGKKRTFLFFLFFCFHDVVWICFSAPPGPTFGQQNGVLENLSWEGFSKKTQHRNHTLEIEIEVTASDCSEFIHLAKPNTRGEERKITLQ